MNHPPQPDSRPSDPYSQYPQQGGAYPQYPQGGAYPQQGGAYPQYPQGGAYPQQPYGGGMPPYASWGARVGAALLDGLIVNLLPMILIIAGYVQFIGAAIDAAENCPIGDTACAEATMQVPGSAWTLICVGALLSLAGLLWLSYKEGSTGQTPGKKALKISVLKEADGSTLGFGMALARRLAHTLDGMACYLGYLWPLWDAKKQTFADKIVSSVVVRR